MIINLIKGCLFTAIFLTPLLAANQFLPFEQIKVYFFTTLIIICAGLLFIYLWNEKKIVFKTNSLDIIFSCFVGLLFLTSYFGINQEASIFGLPAYYQGAILYLFLFLYYLLIRVVSLSARIFTFALLSSSTLVALEAIFEWVGLHFFSLSIPTYNGRVVSTFGQPNLYSGFLLMTIPFCLGLLRNTTKNLTTIGLVFLINVVAILISESRASIALLVFLIGFYIFQLKSKTLSFPIIAFVLSIFFLPLIFLPQLIKKEILDPLNSQWVSSNAPEKRILIWQVAFDQITKRPIFGYGLESFGGVYKAYFDNDQKTNSEEYQNRKNIVVTRTHNYILDLLIFSGFAGLITWMLLIMNLLKKSKEKVFIISLVLYLLWIQIQIQSVVHLIYFYGLAGLISQAPKD